MSFLKNIFGKKDESKISTNEDFWKWFSANEKDFSLALKTQKNIENKFINKLSPKLEELREGYFFLAGMYNDTTVELVLTAEGNIKNILFVEELVSSAPKIDGWKFTALKPALDIENVCINMEGLEFSADNIFFYANEDVDYPDEIDICIIHNDLTDGNFQIIDMGTFVFLENYLGELEFINVIDHVQIVERKDAEKELIPIAKLKDFLIWRQKEFVEKYDGIRYNTTDDEYNILEAELQTGNKLLAVVNTNLLTWDRKASHPWICIVYIKFDGANTNGMPSHSDYEILNAIEDEIMNNLLDADGYLNVGRQTADNEREIYFACKEFRLPSKVFSEIQKKYTMTLETDYQIFKDKYWKTFERFNL